MTALCNHQPSVIAAGIPGVQLLSQTLQSDINILYVSSTGGSDTGGNGSDQAPFKTLTYALSVAPPKTAILLAPGTYSEQTGEKFPLMLRPSVTVQGNPNTRGQNIVIKGGGYFISPTSAGQNITILGADGAGTQRGDGDKYQLSRLRFVDRIEFSNGCQQYFFWQHSRRHFGSGYFQADDWRECFLEKWS